MFLVEFLKSWGVPGGIAIVAVFAFMIYLDSKRSRDIDEERRKQG